MKNPPDALTERASSKEAARRFREPRGPDHSNGRGGSNTGKNTGRGREKDPSRNNSSVENDLELISVYQFTFWLCGCFPVFD